MGSIPIKLFLFDRDPNLVKLPGGSGNGGIGIVDLITICNPVITCN